MSLKYLPLLISLLTVPCLAQKAAVTHEGERVLLFDDGTWEYYKSGEAVPQLQDEPQEPERKEFWTNVAINTAKILGIIAALITLRFIIQAAIRGSAAAEKTARSEETGEEAPQAVKKSLAGPYRTVGKFGFVLLFGIICGWLIAYFTALGPRY